MGLREVFGLRSNTEQASNEFRRVHAPYKDSDVVTIGSAEEALIEYDHRGERFILGCNWPVGDLMPSRVEFSAWVQEAMYSETPFGPRRDIRQMTPEDVQTMKAAILGKLPVDRRLKSIVSCNLKLQEFLGLSEQEAHFSESALLPGNFRGDTSTNSERY